MENHNIDALSRRGNSKERIIKTIGRKSKSRGRSKYLGSYLNNFYRNVAKLGILRRTIDKKKSVERGKGLEDTPSIEWNTSLEEGGDVYLASTIT